jgi:hypothetical protein
LIFFVISSLSPIYDEQEIGDEIYYATWE